MTLIFCFQYSICFAQMAPKNKPVFFVNYCEQSKACAKQKAANLHPLQKHSILKHYQSFFSA